MNRREIVGGSFARLQSQAGRERGVRTIIVNYPTDLDTMLTDHLNGVANDHVIVSMKTNVYAGQNSLQLLAIVASEKP